MVLVTLMAVPILLYGFGRAVAVKFFLAIYCLH